MLSAILLIALLVLFVVEMRHSMRRSRITGRLINTYEHDVHNPALLDEIFDYCQHDYKLKRKMKKYGATREDFQ